MSFTSNGDPALADGSPGSGVEPASIPAAADVRTDGSQTACGNGDRQRRQRLGAGQPHGAGRRGAAEPRNQLSRHGRGRHVGERDVHRLRRPVGARERTRAAQCRSTPSTAGEKTVSTTAIDNVGNETTKSCTTKVEFANSGAPTLSAGTSPNTNGLFTLSWTGSNPMAYFGFSYTLQHHNAATSEWSTVASGIEALSYEFTGAGEEEGTWVYRVQGSDPSQSHDDRMVARLAPVVVDKTPPNAPSATPSRAPDYAGGGGWYKDSVSVSFTSNGDPGLSDGSPGSGVNPASIPASQTFEPSGSHDRERHRDRQRGQRLGDGQPHRAGRRDTAEPGNHLPDDGGDRQHRRARDASWPPTASRGWPADPSGAVPSARAKPGRRRSPAPRSTTSGTKPPARAPPRSATRR